MESFLDPWILDYNKNRVCNTSKVIHLKPDPKLKGILKYHKHSRILTNKAKLKSDLRFSFPRVNRNYDTSKASQDNGIQPVINANLNIFSSFVFQSFNNSTDVSIFTSALKSANIVPVLKNGKKRLKKFKRKYASKMGRGVYSVKFPVTSKISFLNISAGLGKV